MKNFVKLLVTLFINMFYRVELVNKHNIPEKGAALLCANHIHDLDMFFIGYNINRLVHYMAKEELFKIPILAPLIRWLGAFPIKRGKGDVGAIKSALKLLEEGHIVGIFPEGTRTGGKDKKNITIKRGAVMIAINSGVPIIPVGINATYKPFSKVRVVFGEPFYLNVDRDRKYSSEEMNHISMDLMEKIYSLAGEK